MKYKMSFGHISENGLELFLKKMVQYGINTPILMRVLAEMFGMKWQIITE